MGESTERPSGAAATLLHIITFAGFVDLHREPELIRQAKNKHKEMVKPVMKAFLRLQNFFDYTVLKYVLMHFCPYLSSHRL